MARTRALGHRAAVVAPRSLRSAGRRPRHRRPRHPAPARGGKLVASLRSEPSPLQPLRRRDTAADRSRDAADPGARSCASTARPTHSSPGWRSAGRRSDGRTYTLKLRQGSRSPTACRSPPPTSCSRSRPSTTTASQSGLKQVTRGRRQAAQGHRRPTPRPSSSRFPRRSRPACACSTTCRSCPGTSSAPHSPPARSRRRGRRRRRSTRSPGSVRSC